MKYFVLTVLLLTGTLSNAQPYWQQRVDTRIDVSLDDLQHMLRGFATISYTNNSPDTLKFLYLHLWPNAYSHDHTAYAEQQYSNGHTDFYYAKPSERGFIDSIQFSVDGNDVDYFYGESTPDIARIDLPKPVPPGSQSTITTPFRVKLPKVFSRLGHNRQAYFISQWFPKPAVYDRKGWHPMPYLELGEFYSEIGSYDVSITLPRNYVVMATGNLETPSEIKWLDSLSLAPIKADSVRTITTITTVNGQKKRTITRTDIPESAAALKTIRFTEDNVHDFAWFADKRWAVRKDTVTSPGNNNLVTTWSAFLPKHEKAWSGANGHLKKAVRSYGSLVGPYPYKTIKAVQGDLKAGGGMEYPTITIIDINQGNEMTLVHEAGHNWFYGILASNERDHAWMDEGLNTFYEQKTTSAGKGDTSVHSNVKGGDVKVSVGMEAVLYQLAAGGRDQAIAQSSAGFRELNYGMDVYYKSTELLEWLEHYMGPDSFASGMRAYYEAWKHKHPYPEDFRAVMQQHSSRPIGWFFDEALRTDRMIDFSIRSARNSTNGVAVTVRNKTRMSLPVSIKAYDGDSIIAAATSLPFTGSTVLTLPPAASSWTKVDIAPEVYDGRTPNNEFRRSGLVHRSGLRIRPLAGSSTGSRQTLFVAPALGFNMYDGFQAGLLFHNLSWPETKLKYALAPLYGFRSETFTGAGSISYSWRPANRFREIWLQLDGKSFSLEEATLNIPNTLFRRYVKLAPSLNFELMPASALSPVTRRLSIKGYYVAEEQFDFPEDPSDTASIPRHLAVMGETRQLGYGLLRYQHINDRTFNPFQYTAEGQIGESFLKLSVEGKLKINYHAKNKALHIRAYAGKYFGFNDDVGSSRYYLNSTFTGANDYLYDDTYIGRSERTGFGIRQISIREGGLKVPTVLYASPLGRTDNWLAAINLKTDLPLKNLPIRLFLDVASFADAGKLNPSGSKVLFDGGVEIYLLDIINIYVPLVMSKDFTDYRKSITGKTSILDGITFSINLQHINWLKAPTGAFRLFGY